MQNNPPITLEGKLLYSTINAAAMLDISRSQFYNIVKKYNIQPVRIFGDSRWRHEDLLRLINGEIPAENQACSASAL